MTGKEAREMVDSELLRMLEAVANREIPCTVAYEYILKKLKAAHAKGKRQRKEKRQKQRLLTKKEKPQREPDLG